MRRPTGAVWVLALAALVSSAGPAVAATEVKLPSATETIQAQIDAEQLLRGGRGPERTLPGDVEDRERVMVAIDAEGAPHEVGVEQRLTLEGVGDFFIKIPGPATDVEALPKSSSQPGLRSGSVVWQGFANDGELLAARIELDPRLELERLPLTIEIDGTIDGEPIDVAAPRAGALDLTITVTNNTTRSMEQLSADPANDRDTAAALDTVRSRLEEGERPEPGSAGIPRTISVDEPIDETPEDLVAPLQAIVSVRLPDGTTDVRATPATVSLDDAAGPGVIESSALLSGSERSAVVHITATIPAKGFALSVTGTPAPPGPDEIEPPGAGTWVDATEAGTVEGRAMFESLYRVTSEAAWLPEIDGYLGNPDRDGPTSSTYTFVLRTPRAAEAPPSPPEPEVETDPLRIALVGLGLVALLLGLLRWWSVS